MKKQVWTSQDLRDEMTKKGWTEERMKTTNEKKARRALNLLRLCITAITPVLLRLNLPFRYENQTFKCDWFDLFLVEGDTKLWLKWTPAGQRDILEETEIVKNFKKAGQIPPEWLSLTYVYSAKDMKEISLIISNLYNNV